MTKLDLNERKQRLLMTLVERHIRDGQPVGSKTLARNEQGTIGDWTQDMSLAEFYWDSAHPSKTKERPRNGQRTNHCLGPSKTSVPWDTAVGQ